MIRLNKPASASRRNSKLRLVDGIQTNVASTSPPSLNTPSTKSLTTQIKPASGTSASIANAERPMVRSSTGAMALAAMSARSSVSTFLAALLQRQVVA